MSHTHRVRVTLNMSLKEREYPWVNTASELPLCKHTNPEKNFPVDLLLLRYDSVSLIYPPALTGIAIVELKYKLQSKGLHYSMSSPISVRQVKARRGRSRGSQPVGK